VKLLLVIHAHQPAGNFDSVLEDVYRLAYRPFLEELRRRAGIRVAFHYSGILLEWLEKRHPEYFDWLGELIEAGRVELLGGGYYEPILSAIPERDRLAQLERMSRYLERRFGRAPRGAWLTERVWDPTLPQTLARAGLDYTLTDDHHFLSAGLDPDQLYGYYLTEWQGYGVKVIPGLQKLRYLLPFRMENDAIAYLHDLNARVPGAMAAMGDDLEKFGAWPKTHDHVYRDGWLRRFFDAVENAGGWLTTALAGDAVSSRGPLGRIYLPTASYPEMMGWALPASAASHYEALRHRVDAMPEAPQLSGFVHGGLWHNFFHKYEEANHLHKRMLDVSRRYEELDRAVAPAGEARRRLEPGYDRLLRAQCNDAYWHGVFGGLYAPHLRAAVWQALLEGEAALDELAPAVSGPRRLDFNLDGQEEVFLSNDCLRAIASPADGGTVSEIVWRPLAFNAVNSLRRRPEAYHAKLREASAGDAGAQSIHDRVVAKEAGLEHYLHYDRYNRHAFRCFVFGPGRSLDDYRFGRLEESPQFAGGPFEIVSAAAGRCTLQARAADCHCEANKQISLHGSSVIVEWKLRSGGPAPLTAGLEVVLNLLAPDAHDRYFVLPENGQRPRLHWAGEARGPSLALVDEYLNLRIELRATPAPTWWVLPIFTVSLSEDGFEKVYQGSTILPHWPLTGSALDAILRLDFAPAR